MDLKETLMVGFVCLLAGFIPAGIVGCVSEIRAGQRVSDAYLRGQIDQASGVATVTLTTQPNGESRWEPTTKASK